MGAIEYRIKQKSQNLLNYGDISLIELRISTIFWIEFRIRDPPPIQAPINVSPSTVPPPPPSQFIIIHVTHSHHSAGQIIKHTQQGSLKVRVGQETTLNHWSCLCVCQR